MRRIALFLLAALAAAQDDPWRGPTKVVKDETGRITMRVPGVWEERERSGRQVLHVGAPAAYGGHVVIVDRDGAQADVRSQLQRYLEHDTARHANAKVRKFEEPLAGYRIDAPDEKQVKVRAFVTDGRDGLVITAASRDAAYDERWAALIEAVVGSVRVDESVPAPGDAAADPVLSTARRVHDARGRLSAVVPAGWAASATEDEDEWLAMEPATTAHGKPRLSVRSFGGPMSATLVLTTVYTRWGRSYPQLTEERVGDAPPRMVLRGRKPEYIDYVIGLSDGDGFAVILSVRESSYEALRDLADAVAASVVFRREAYAPPEAPGGVEASDRSFAVHAASEGEAADVLAELADFARGWKKIGPPADRKAPMPRVRVVPAAEYAEASHHFAPPPAAYDRKSRVVVCVPPPEGERGAWRSALYGALAENLLHRDLPAAPPWLVSGLRSCMEAAGSAGGDAEAPHPKLVVSLLPFSELAAKSEGDFARDDGTLAGAAWVWTHWFEHGSGRVPGIYRKWRKDLEAGRAAPLDLHEHEGALEDLARHMERAFR